MYLFLLLTDVVIYFIVNKVQQLLQGLQAVNDEGQQLTAVIEMCQVIFILSFLCDHMQALLSDLYICIQEFNI